MKLWIASVVPTNDTIPLNVTAPDKCHNSPRQKSQPTTNVTTLPRQMSQPPTNVTTALDKCHSQRQMSQHCLDKCHSPRQMAQLGLDKCHSQRQMAQLGPDKCHSQRQMAQLGLDKCHSQRQNAKHYHDYQRQMSRTPDKCQSSLFHWLVQLPRSEPGFSFKFNVFILISLHIHPGRGP